MVFRIKRGGADRRLACLLNADRLARCHGLELQNRIDEPLQHLGVRSRCWAALSAVHFFVHMMWQRTRKPGPLLQKQNDANPFKL
ncbi:MAG TPA: hypothetical protein VNR65_08810 [Geobacterales bacterium]|jgi:hypothetical protein|nr:hypothetical protein [Geobacterales bacterium]